MVGSTITSGEAGDGMAAADETVVVDVVHTAVVVAAI